ncbi:PspC domain-containing protein [Cellulophaga fucicola]|uniref:Phage shock protein C (PspC) family protein n=1 Tax=Cellulophaga fucicola TaxID=76595 RepID=A0A1K1LV92_9FLAO|nr:PspC domain-containing protein [Cellulophaga fucicola]SFW14825.1 phage shock protein C (PspC) family protein [Cellulophaga fucicola]
MNKTININLANLFFHIDEDAYRKLDTYLKAIKQSLNNGPGSDEIISDIEGRIAELFQEKIKNEQQVITKTDVEDVIAVMGQPEDYRVDEEIFEDEEASASKSKTKKLYRDTDNKYIGGISAGMAHYLGINPWWVRLLWVVLTLATFSGFIVIYILLLFLIPEAKTTSQKLDMRGESINISNIERTVKESFNSVTDKVKNADYNKASGKFKTGIQAFFDAIGTIFNFIFKSIGKIIGVFFILIGGAVVIGTFIGLFTAGFTDAFVINNTPIYSIVNSTSAPIWLISLLTFFAVAIPFFFLLYLGLKIVVSNLKSIGTIAKITLFGVWLAAIIGLTIVGIKEATANMYKGSVNKTEVLNFTQPLDTLYISTRTSKNYDRPENFRINGMTFTLDENGKKLLLDNDFIFDIVRSNDDIARIKIQKVSQGSSFDEARDRAKTIEYNYQVLDNKVVLDNFLMLDPKSKIRDQEVNITLYIPKGVIIKFDYDADTHNIGWHTSYKEEIYRSEVKDYTWVMNKQGVLDCLDCPSEDIIEEEADEFEKETKLSVDEEGVNIKINGNESSLNIKIDENGARIEASKN